MATVEKSGMDWYLPPNSQTPLPLFAYHNFCKSTGMVAVMLGSLVVWNIDKGICQDNMAIFIYSCRV